MMITTYNKLPFGSIDEPRPKKNEITHESLNWYDMNSLEQLHIFCNIHTKKIMDSLVVNRN